MHFTVPQCFVKKERIRWLWKGRFVSVMSLIEKTGASASALKVERLQK